MQSYYLSDVPLHKVLSSPLSIPHIELIKKAQLIKVRIRKLAALRFHLAFRALLHEIRF